MKKHKQTKYHEDVEEQKGPIVECPISMKTMTHEQRLAERDAELRGIKWGQYTDLHEPKR